MVLWSAGSLFAGAVEERKAERPKKPYWSDALKGIPLGPLSLDIGGSVRLRYEYQNDFNIQRYADDRRPGFRSDHFLLHRTRLDFDLHLSEEARLYTEFQDARVYESNFRKDDFILGCPYWNPFDLRQAYLEWLHIGDSPFGIKIGRQAIFYGDNRIWGPGEWGNVGRYTWDAVKLITDTDWFFFQTLYKFQRPEREEKTDGTFDKSARWGARARTSRRHLDRDARCLPWLRRGEDHTLCEF
jgi:hypothetical protein